MTVAFDWLKPSPLWDADGLDFRQMSFFRPQLFEFRSDTFMEDFLTVAAASKPDAFRAALATPLQTGNPLKLFQPIHGCFYVACGSLCCRLPGFPDREIRSADGESAFFVLRKLVGSGEYAWTVTDTEQGWQPLNGQSKRVLKGEERQPMFTTTTANGRSILFGYLPVASRETFAVPPSELTLGEGEKVTDLRIEELGSRFGTPFTPPTVVDAAKDEGIALTLSVYLLLDLWEYLFQYLPDVATALRDNPAASFSGDQAQAKANLMAFLKTQELKGSLKLAAALGAVARKRDTLNQTGGVNPDQLAQLGFNATYNLKGIHPDTEGLQQRVKDALPTELPPIELPKLDPQADTQYVLRCVYERPQCDPPIYAVSQPSEPFIFAPVFDPDAPTRPIRIPLPADVSIAGLRKFKKGVTFVMSDAMRRKMERLTGKEKTLLGDDPSLNPEPLDDGFAFICSFSFEIIFIVAFFLLLMFVVILNFVFWWIAFFKICLPVPKRLLPG